MWIDFALDELDDFQRLQPIQPQFFIPRIADVPQNPILDTLNRKKPQPFRFVTLKSLPIFDDAPVIAQEKLDPPILKENGRKSIIKNKIASWDTLCALGEIDTASPILSEQDGPDFVSIRHHVKPIVRNDAVDIVHVSESRLLEALKLNVLGSSSSLYTWDASSEQFLLRGVQPGNVGRLIIDGKEDSVGKSVIRSFLAIGTILHRLDNFVLCLREEYALSGPTVNAFSHALASILKHIRDSLNHCSARTLSTFRMQCSPYHEVLLSLSKLCDREEDKTPADYPSVECSPRPLLARIYQHLVQHIEMSSTCLVRAVFAYLLTVVSRDLVQEVCHSVGYGKQPPISSQIEDLVNTEPLSTMDPSDETEVDADGVVPLSDNQDNLGPLPPFFPPELAESIGAAQKSLKLLKAAKADHPILKEAASYPVIKWFWREDQVLAAWNGEDISRTPAVAKSPPFALPVFTNYPPELAGLSVFDLEPGASLGPFPSHQPNSSQDTLQEFLKSFPESLPSLTPTLPQLCSLVFAPLAQYSSRLSSALLGLILVDSSYLAVSTHLQLLRSYLLLTADSFKSRLVAALFSDSGDLDTPGNHVLLVPVRSPHKADSTPWPVGLAPMLLQRDTWPPVGTDLSFLLRTVIVDSLELGVDAAEMEQRSQGRRRILEEAEFRLGFAIRDLPVDTGREKWLNPLSIEALDFLYMDYKPPHPIDVVITPDVLSKYQRVFAFLLRLLRAQCAVQAIFRMTRPSPLFPTLTPSNKMLLNFRFLAQSFVSVLCEYAYDTVIGGNFDTFLSKLSSGSDPTEIGFTDIFALASAHSSVLDDILTALLLRSGQRNVGDLLRHALEIVLEFSILVGQLRRGDLQEYEAAPLLSDLHSRFLSKVAVFVRVLKGLNDKGQFSRAPIDVVSEKQPLRGVQCLQDLLLRLDLGSWWQHK